MADEIVVRVRHENDQYGAHVQPDQRADQLLLKSLHHFGIDPADKADWQLVRREGDSDERIVLDRPIGEQVEPGGEVRLQADDADARRTATGSY